MLVILPWSKDVENDELCFCKTQMWLQAMQIPSQWLSPETAWKIGNIFKQCLNAYIPESGSREGRVAKMLVEVDLNNLLIRGTFI